MSLPAFEGFVLAGGHSVRMGVDKSLINWRGHRLVDRWISALQAIGAERTTVLHRDPSSLVTKADRVLVDRYGGQGPLDGVLTAIGESRCEFALIVAVDLVVIDPNLDERLLLSRLVEAAAVDGSSPPGRPPDVVAVRTPDDGLQLLLAAWRVESVIARLRSAFDGGERSVHALAETLAVTAVDLPAGSIGNLNRPSDLSSDTHGWSDAAD